LLDQKVYTIFYVERDGEIISMQLVLTFNQRAYSHLAAATPDGYKLGAPSFMHYASVFYLKEQAFKTYNLGSIPLGKANEGLRKFKESLGARAFLMSDEETRFLIFPLSLLNPFMIVKKWVKLIRMPYSLKKIILSILNRITMGKDEY